MSFKRPYLPSLDGIRAVSFLLVFLAHAGLYNVVPGGLGVTIFFFLSGYLITTLLRVEYDATGHIDLRQFYLRRILRIFPPFYAMLVLSLAVAALWVIPSRIQWQGLLAQVLYLYNYYSIAAGSAGIPPGTDVYWSLAVEEHFYAFFPFLFLLLCRTRASGAARALWLLGACVLVLAWRLVLVHLLDSSPLRTYVATDTRIDSILYGCILASYRNPALDVPQEDTGRRDATVAGILAGLGLLGLLLSLVYRAAWFRETLRYSLQGISLLPIFYAAVRYPHWLVFRPLNWPVVKWFGVLSYSLYLVHFLVLMIVGRYVGTSILILQGLGLPICVALATLMHYAIERPAARLKGRLTQSAVPTAAAPVARRG